LVIEAESTLFVVTRGMILAHTVPTVLATRRVAFNQDLKSLRVRQELATPEFLSWQLTGLQSPLLARVETAGHGTKRLPTEALGNLPLALPPLPTQRAIAAYLDRETERIDALVAKKERLLELLDEKRSALISHAVTKGLDPDAPMKDSGVEWVGEIPEEWEVVRFGWLTRSRCDGPFGAGLKSDHYSDAGVRVVRLGNIGFARFRPEDEAYIPVQHYRTLGEHSVVEGDILVAGLGDANHPVGRACVAPDGLGTAMVKADCFRFRVDPDRLVPQYAAYALSSQAKALGTALATGATRARVNLSATADRRLPVPPTRAQHDIADHLDRETAKIDALKAKVVEAIDRLKEYRTALISAAVTGQIEVPDLEDAA
jgi:type I restriction enzyme S subunit